MSGGPAARARLFVALEPSAEVRAALAGWAERAIGREPGVRLLDAEALHLTLCFLGELSLTEVDGVSAAIADVVPGGVLQRPPVFWPEAVRRLPARRPRVCAVSLHDLDGRGGMLQSALSARLADGGWYEPERRRWLAHVTVARMSARGGRGGRVVDPPAPELEPFGATAVALMRSWPGSRYEALARIEL